MKSFRTEIKLKPSAFTLHPKSSIVTGGSCFADAIGTRLAAYKINTLVNPFGIIYNPESIHKIFTYSLLNEPLAEDSYLRHQEIHLNYNLHSEFSAPDKEQLQMRLRDTLASTHASLEKADWLLLTYGTAWVYRRKDTSDIVANCHKLPSGMFSKSLLMPETIAQSFNTFYANLKRLNRQIRVIVTVSPVRHLKDTLELNSVSKSVLRLACHTIANDHPDIDYFPAYEMMVDDLRDYRFYKADMLHPTSEAEDYIFEKFMERYFSEEVKDFAKKWTAVLSAMRHKPFHPQSSMHQQFLQETLRKLKELQDLVDVDQEIASVQQQIIKQTGHD
jgi:hypothetical protein